MSQEPYIPERRPIASRERQLSKRVAHWLATRGVSPNAISLAGMAAGIAAGLALAATSSGHFERLAFIAAALLMQLRLLANMLDGMVAVETERASPIGELFNEVPDRVSDAAMFIGAGYATGSSPALGYLAACLAIFAAYVRVQGKVAGADQEFCGPMGKPQRVFAVTLLALVCGLAPAGWQPRLAALPDWGLMAFGLCVMIAGTAATAVRRLGRIGRKLKEHQP